MRLPAGRFGYALAMLAEPAALRPIRYRIVLGGGEVREVEATLVAVGNGPSCGGGMRVGHGADLTDGLLDVTVVGACTRATLLRVVPTVHRGTHLGHPVVSVLRATRVGPAADGVTGHADGEPVGALPLVVRCVPAAVRVLTR